MDRKTLVGIYDVAKAMCVLGGKLGMHALEEVETLAPEEEREELLRMFSARIEFTEDNRVIEWIPIPPGVPEEAIKAALESGEIEDFRDGFFCRKTREWKEENGEFSYNTGEHRELFGEALSSWDKLELDDDGLLPFGSGMMRLKKI